MLRRLTFGDLFLASFTVGACFAIGLGLLGALSAFMAPGMFSTGQGAAQSPVQALGVDLFLVVVCLAFNLVVSGAGSAIWVLVRRVLPNPGQTAE